MIELLTSIDIKLKEGEITKNQALYMIFLENDISYSIPQKELLELGQKRYIRGNKVTKKMKTISHVENSSVKGTIVPKYMNEASKQVMLKLCKLLCVRHKDGKLKLPGDNENPLEFTASHYLKGEGLIARHYIIFLFMFPISGEVNRRWESTFTGTTYKGASIRRRSVENARLFKTAVKTRDMGAFLYGTYLYIKSNVREGQPFITTVPRYFKQFEDWYADAYEILKKNPDIDKLFRRDERGTKGNTLQRMI